MPLDPSAKRRLRPLFGTLVEVGVAADACAARALDAAYRAMHEVHTALSFHDPQSELSRLNASRGEWMPVSPLLARLLRLGRAMCRDSGGLFNHTVGGALVRAGALPDHGGSEPLEAGDYHDVVLRRDAVRLRRAVRVTLDGIAKGYGVDCAVRALRRTGTRWGWVNAGGDLRAFGDCALPVALRGGDGLTALGELREGALATSEFGAADERFPARLIDPRAAHPGRPASAARVSVLARYAWRADALTKVAALAPAVSRARWVELLGGRLLDVAPAPH
jgi:FAD:protein FMN transferase